MVKCNINLCSVLNPTTLCKMSEVARLQNLAAAKIISDNISILPFSIPTHLFEDLRSLNSVKLLREEENYLNKKNEALEKYLPEAIERYNYYSNRYNNVSIWDEDLILYLFVLSDDCQKIVKKIQELTTESNNRKEQRDMEEEFSLAKLSEEYNGIQFKHVETEYNDISYFLNVCSQDFNSGIMLFTLERWCDGEL